MKHTSPPSSRRPSESEASSAIAAALVLVGALNWGLVAIAEFDLVGRVGAEVSVEQAYHAARATGLSILALLKRDLGDLNRVTGGAVATAGGRAGAGSNPVSPFRREPRVAGRSAFAVAAPMAWRQRRGAARGTQSSVQVLVRLACRSVPGSAKAWRTGPERLL
jgi:uncharacterized membrane protein YuzA (DUF378 family)